MLSRHLHLYAALAAAALLGAAPAEVPLPLTVDGDPSARVMWTRAFASPADDWINDVVPISGGRYLAVGFLNRDGMASDWRALAVTLREDGAILSSREYGAGGGVDAFWSAQEAADGGLVFAGFTTRIGNGDINGYTLLTDAEGIVLRENGLGGGGYDRFTDLAPAGDGSVFLGHSQLPDEEIMRRIFIVKTDRNTIPVWERIIDGPDSLAGLYIEPAGDGGFVIAGGLGRGEDSDVLVIKVDPDGRELWRRTIGTPENQDVNHGLVVLPGGNIVVVAYSQSWNAQGNDILAATLSPSGEILRREMLGGAGDDRPTLAKADGGGRVWIVGSTTSAGAGGWDLILARLSSAGSFEAGALTLGGADDDNGTAVHALSDGSILVAGYSNAPGHGGQDAFVARLSAPSFDRPHPILLRRVIR